MKNDQMGLYVNGMRRESERLRSVLWKFSEQSSLQTWWSEETYCEARGFAASNNEGPTRSLR